MSIFIEFLLPDTWHNESVDTRSHANSWHTTADDFVSNNDIDDFSCVQRIFC